MTEQAVEKSQHSLKTCCVDINRACQQHQKNSTPQTLRDPGMGLSTGQPVDVAVKMMRGWDGDKHNPGTLACYMMKRRNNLAAFG